MSRLQSQFVGRERHAPSLTSFQKAAARAPDQQDWSDLVFSKRRARRFLLIDNAHASPWVNSKEAPPSSFRAGAQQPVCYFDTRVTAQHHSKRKASCSIRGKTATNSSSGRRRAGTEPGRVRLGENEGQRGRHCGHHIADKSQRFLNDFVISLSQNLTDGATGGIMLLTLRRRMLRVLRTVVSVFTRIAVRVRRCARTINTTSFAATALLPEVEWLRPYGQQHVGDQDGENE